MTIATAAKRFLKRWDRFATYSSIVYTYKGKKDLRLHNSMMRTVGVLRQAIRDSQERTKP